jgi:hypothetical protein
MTEPLDDLDLAILDQIAAVHAAVDPPPPDLDLRVRFALDLGDLEVELARRTEDELVGPGARAAAERTRTITFEADSRTVMITIGERPDGLLRVDGWLAPAAPLRVELRFPDPQPARTELADEAGRFVFDEVERGLVQLLVHPPDDTGPQVVTPALTL